MHPNQKHAHSDDSQASTNARDQLIENLAYLVVRRHRSQNLPKVEPMESARKAPVSPALDEVPEAVNSSIQKPD